MRGKQRSPPGFRPAGTKVGNGSSPSSLSRADIWRPKGCRLPDAILHGKRNCGLIAGPSSALRSRGFRVRPLSSLGLAFAAPACEPDKDTFVTCCSASLPFNAGSATAFGSALARCHGSDLLPLRLHLAHKPAVFLHRRRFGREGLCRGPFPSRRACSFCLAFRRLSFGGLANPPESMRSVLAHSSNRLPSG